MPKDKFLRGANTVKDPGKWRSRENTARGMTKTEVKGIAQIYFPQWDGKEIPIFVWCLDIKINFFEA